MGVKKGQTNSRTRKTVFPRNESPGKACRSSVFSVFANYVSAHATASTFVYKSAIFQRF